MVFQVFNSLAHSVVYFLSLSLLRISRWDYVLFLKLHPHLSPKLLQKLTSSGFYRRAEVLFYSLQTTLESLEFKLRAQQIGAELVQPLREFDYLLLL